MVSGRIIRDKLFFTTNYEGYIERSSEPGVRAFIRLTP